jgi:hypothetical protein
MGRKKFDSNIKLRNVEGTDVPDFGATAIFAKDDRLWSMDSTGDWCMGGYTFTDGGDDSSCFLGVAVVDGSAVKNEISALDAGTNVGTRLLQTLAKTYYTAGKNSATYANGDELATVKNVPTALSQLTNDANYVTDASYVHTDNNYAAAEKGKLAGLDGNHFKGSYSSLTALQTAYPSASDGDYTYVGTAGTGEVNYIWDATDEQWVAGGGGTAETPASVKAKYESNDDTNAYTDGDAGTVATIGGVADLATAAKSTIVAAVDEVVAAFGKLQAQVSGGGSGGGDYVKLSTVTVSFPVVYVTFSSIFDADLHSCYAVYFSVLTPSSSTDVSLFMHLVSSTTARNGTSDNITFNSWEYGTTYASSETIGKYVAITGLPISSPAHSTGTPGAIGSMLIAAPATAGKAQLIGSAMAHTPNGGFATKFSFAGGLNASDSIDGFPLFFSSGNVAAGTVTVFGVKKS